MSACAYLLVLAHEFSSCGGVVLGEQSLHRYLYLVGVSTVPPRVGKAQLHCFNQQVEILSAVVLNACMQTIMYYKDACAPAYNEDL